LLRRLRLLILRNLRRRKSSWAASGHAAVRERLSDYLDDALGRRDRRRIQAHLKGCPSCHAFARTLSRTVALLGQLPTQQMPTPTRARLRERLAAEVREGVLV
jgi:predicted anti-sigma-YlaC factor YlaD